MKIESLENAFKDLRSGQSVFVHSAACSPTPLLKTLVDEIVKRQLNQIKIYHLHLEGEAPHAQPGMEKYIDIHCFFIGANCRQAVQEGRATYIPIFLSEIPRLFQEKIITIDLALIQISPFDHNGYTTLGPSVDVSLTAVHHAKKIVAMMNPRLPKVLGDGVLHQRDIHTVIEVDFPLHENICSTGGEDIMKIGQWVAQLIDHGSTLQTGIGEIPNAVLDSLHHHRDLGIHTEMFSDGVVDLIQKGVVTNRFKKIHPWKVVSSFATGSQKLYRFLHENPLMQFMGTDFVNDPRVILKNPKVCAINSAIEIDLSGQICADSIGPKMYSGVGGQVDFMRGAALSPGGKAIIALTSRTKKGISKIKSTLTPGAGVTTSRAHVQYIVTEFGVADLRGKSLKERQRLLINIAHPNDRERLAREALI